MKYSCKAMLIGLVALSLLMTGCDQSQDDGLPDGLAERVDARWQAVMAQDYETAYALLSPGYRSSVEMLDYRDILRRNRLKWISAEVQELQCQPASDSSCKVKVQVEYEISQPMRGVGEFSSHRSIEESWVKSEGDWWYLPEM